MMEELIVKYVENCDVCSEEEEWLGYTFAISNICHWIEWFGRHLSCPRARSLEHNDSAVQKNGRYFIEQLNNREFLNGEQLYKQLV